MKNPLGSIGLVLFGMTLGSVAFAQQATPAPDAQMHTIATQLEAKLNRVATNDADRAYSADMAAISPAIIALCKKELAYGKRAAVKVEADHLLTVQQQYDAQIQEMERAFNIDHSP
jgi:hypothetical protein